MKLIVMPGIGPISRSLHDGHNAKIGSMNDREYFMTIISNANSGNQFQRDLKTLTKTCSTWFVRRDHKFYDVNRLSSPLCRDDVERMLLNRIATEFDQIQLTQELIKGLFQEIFDKRQTDMTRSIQVWNGAVVCNAGDEQRLIPSDGAVAANAWRKPDYRNHLTNSADYGVIEAFFDAFFKTEAEKNLFLDWLAWCLQNEVEKPSWAPFLYSRHKGTGKSTACRVLRELFGNENTATQNNLDKLTQRFNATVLRSKLVICEETHLRPGSSQGNAIKTYITEEMLLVEAKGKEAETIRNVSCFVLTSNHFPNWFETGERRYMVFDVDHDGCAGGPKHREFVSLVARVHDFLDDPRNVVGLYQALMNRRLNEGFSAKTLDLSQIDSPIMKRLSEASRQTIVDQLEEALNQRGLVALPESEVVSFVRRTLGANPNQTKHLMDDLEWQKQKVKWGGKDYARAIWLKPGYYVHQGTILGPDFEPMRVAEYLEANCTEFEVEII